MIAATTSAPVLFSYQILRGFLIDLKASFPSLLSSLNNLTRMNVMKDGVYKTRPLYGKTIRMVRVSNGCVDLIDDDSKFRFTVSDFFSVNVVIDDVECTSTAL